MRHIRYLAISLAAAALLAPLPHDAVAQAKDTEATTDHGPCPKDYEKFIKERFESGFLNAYAGEPTIWPPQKFSYRDLLLGTVVGYLVPVMADLSRGNRMFLGKHLYGFMFKNDEMVREINPNNMRSLRLREAIGPFPKDERDWKEGHAATSSNPIVIEYVLPGETVQNWSELITVQIVSNVSLEIDAKRFVSEVEKQHKSRKQGCETVAHSILSSDETSVLYEQSLVNCAPLRNEYSIRKVIRGPRAISEVSYAKTSELTDAEKKVWEGIIGKTALLSDCPKP